MLSAARFAQTNPDLEHCNAYLISYSVLRLGLPVRSEVRANSVYHSTFRPVPAHCNCPSARQGAQLSEILMTCRSYLVSPDLRATHADGLTSRKHKVIH